MIECTGFEEMNRGFLVGVAEIYLSDTEEDMSDVKLWCKENRYWVSVPSKSIEKDGKKIYIPFRRKRDPQKEKAFLEGIKEAIIIFRAKNPPKDTELPYYR